jgi:hypothetical protein
VGVDVCTFTYGLVEQCGEPLQGGYGAVSVDAWEGEWLL